MQSSKNRIRLTLICLFTGLILTSCANSEWSSDDQNKLLDRCQNEGGNRSYCKCYLKNAMEEYPNAEDIDEIDFESAVELSIDCE